jgi:uncharacterized protein (TIGR00255 family)
LSAPVTSLTNPVRSMTGFAAERCRTSLGELSVSLRGVNHRGLDLHFHGSSEFSVFENEMRALLKKSIARGHVEVRAALTRVLDAQASFNRDALARHIAAFRQASGEFGLSSEPDLNRLFTIPGILSESSASDGLPDSFLPELLEALERCAHILNQHREREGEALRNDIAKHAAEIEQWTHEIAAIRDEARPHFEARLREKLSELLSSSSVTESRLVEEAALLSDRSDIQEELVRLKVHTAELQRLLASGGEIGKRLDFLLQEMNREINTALSKSANAGEPGLRITNRALSLKANIERIREQGLNLE